jgi:hypothetical protein
MTRPDARVAAWTRGLRADGIELVKPTPDEVLVALKTLQCNHALNLAVPMLAALRGRFTF